MIKDETFNKKKGTMASIHTQHKDSINVSPEKQIDVKVITHDLRTDTSLK